MKKGPKPFIGQKHRLMPLNLIARELGVSVRTVHADLHSALRKLKIQSRFGITINTIYAVAEEYHPELQAQSAECRSDFVSQWRQQ